MTSRQMTSVTTNITSGTAASHHHAVLDVILRVTAHPHQPFSSAASPLQATATRKSNYRPTACFTVCTKYASKLTFPLPDVTWNASAHS